MKATLQNSSVVLVARKGCTIPPVNHDLLKSREILLKEDDGFNQPNPNSFSTPPASQTRYNNGFSISTELNRMTIQYSNQPGRNEKKCISSLEKIAANCLSLFSHIGYSEIGINFMLVREGYKIRTDNLIRSDVDILTFDKEKGEISNITLSYKIKGKHFNASISGAQEVGGSKKATVFNINIHYPDNYSDNKTSIIEESSKNLELANKFADRFEKYER